MNKINKISTKYFYFNCSAISQNKFYIYLFIYKIKLI